MFKEAFSYPLESDNFVKNVLITFTSVLFFPLSPLALGYFTKIIQNKGAKREFPEYGEWKNLYITGVKYSLVAIIWISLGISTSYIVDLIGFEPLNILNGLFGLVLIYSLPAIYREFAENESISDGFSPSNKGYILSGHYFKAFIYLAVSYFVITLAQVALVITIVGALVVPFTLAYEAMVYSSLIGEVRPE